MTTDSSPRTLLEKLGLRAGATVAFFNPPDEYFEALGELPTGLRYAGTVEQPTDFIHFFTAEQAELARQFPVLKQMLRPDGVLWISWPKQSSILATSLNENVVREIGLAHGLVDVKVVAIDENWSGLKFVYRKEER